MNRTVATGVFAGKMRAWQKRNEEAGRILRMAAPIAVECDQFNPGKSVSGWAYHPQFKCVIVVQFFGDDVE